MKTETPTAVALADADGHFTSTGMSRLVLEAKARKLRQAKKAKEARARRKVEEAERKRKEADRLAAEKAARKTARAAAVARREAHRKNRTTDVDASTLEENKSEREDEMEALESMYGEDDSFVRTKDGFTMRLSDGRVVVRVRTPPAYPSSSPPEADLTFDRDDLSIAAEENDLIGKLEDIWMDGDGIVVLFEWIEWVREWLESH